MPWFEGFVRALAWVAAVLFCAAGLMLTYEVIARYFFVRPTIWAAELSQLCLIWGCLMGMPWLLSARRHIAVDAVIRLLPQAAQNRIEAVAMLMVAAFSAIVAWFGWGIFQDSFERGRTTGSMLDLPSWVVELAVPVGFALLFVQALIETLRSAQGRAADRETVVE
ncbi:TRAP transporter small permease [Rhodobacteraceae bacterium F11138]|nr:TRAP transporter small permease [Rhodobacteraceae bacterium F11138]